MKKRMILMRGLPSCGKTTTARRLAEEQGGVHIEFDAYFQREEGEGGRSYAWSREELPEARRWHLERVKQAIEEGAACIVVDDDHHPCPLAKAVVACGLIKGYEIEFAEPDTAWWIALRPLLDCAAENPVELSRWAAKLACLNRGTHRVSGASIERRMRRWKPDLSPMNLLSWNSTPPKTPELERQA